MLRPGDETGIGRLQRHLWGTGTAVNIRYLTWKYLDNPYLTEPIVIVAESHGRIVGMRAIFGSAWEVPGADKPIVAPCAADLVIDPDHRDQGLYDEMNRLAYAELTARGFTNLFNFTANPENYLSATLTQGWKPAGSFEILTRRSAIGDRAASIQPRIVDSSRLYGLARKGLAVGRRLRGSVRVDPFRHLVRHARVANTSVPISVSKQPPVEEMASLVSRIDRAGVLRHVRDESYLRWRYANPRSTYSFLTWGSGEIDGYLVLQNLEGRARTAIVDWEAADPNIGQQLARYVVDHARLGSLRTWTSTLPPTTTDFLREYGFEETFTEGPLRYAGRFLVKPLTAPAPYTDLFAGIDLTDMGNWDLRMIYGDAL
ncbi:MAG: hypothetical protein ACR2P0_07635 [Acidimicrobiales bacterium]